jgi:arylformamidase
MRIYDVTVGISPQMPVWPGDPGVQLERVESIASGANANVSRLSCGVHTGTHVDAPLHFIDGAGAVDLLPLKLLTGRAYVVHLPAAKVIDEATLEAAGLPPRTRRVCSRTRNSELWAKEKAQTNFVSTPVALAGCAQRRTTGGGRLPGGALRAKSKALHAARSRRGRDEGLDSAT